MGFGLIEPTGRGSAKLHECGVIRTDARLDLWLRLEELYDGVTEVVERFRPSTMTIETIFHGKNPRSAMSLAHARGVILLVAAKHNLAVREFAPASIKQAITGSGQASKDQVAYMLQKLLRLQAPPTPADAADGVAVALTSIIKSGNGL
ncbi:MAG: crossover junction endodeoxyribonuclease RuvC [Gemmatimonadetes bacterium]|nr:crossover junction endodeoxyribonuclease RuvC [Gemmatimonadota bacterium]